MEEIVERTQITEEPPEGITDAEGCCSACLSLWTALALTAASKSFSSRELLSAIMFSFPVSVCYSCFLDSPLWCSSKWGWSSDGKHLIRTFQSFWSSSSFQETSEDATRACSSSPRYLPTPPLIPRTFLLCCLFLSLFMSFITLLKSPSVRKLTYTFILKKLKWRRCRLPWASLSNRNLHEVTSVHPLLLSLLARAATLNSDS